MKLFNWFKNLQKPKYDLTFYDTLGDSWIHNPPIRAKDLRPLKDHQLSVYNDYKFVHCPGMHDYSRLGYIIPAWVPFHIKANKGGTVILTGSKDRKLATAAKKANPEFDPRPMEYAIADGTFTPKNINKEVSICPSPWKIKGAPGVSLIVTAPYFHNKIFVDKLFIYPGVVDYDGFHVINFVFSVREECEITINQGDPLLHVIPIYNDRDIKASYKPATELERQSLSNSKNFFERNFYRRYYLNKKNFLMEPDFDPKQYGGKKVGVAKTRDK